MRDYLEFLEDLLVIGIAYLKGDKAMRAKEKKTFFKDPFVLKCVADRVHEGNLESDSRAHSPGAPLQEVRGGLPLKGWRNRVSCWRIKGRNQVQMVPQEIC